MLVGVTPRPVAARLPEQLRLVAAGGRVAALPCPTAVAGRLDRHALQRRQRVDPVLRGLHEHVVGDPGLRVHPVVRGRLLRAGQRDQQVLGHVPLGQPDLVGQRPVDVHPQVRGGRDLRQVQVGDARLAPQLGHHLAGQLRVPGVVPERAVDLHVDRAGQPEVQHLGDDVRRLEEERQLRELPRQLPPEQVDVLRGRAVVLGERDQDLAVGRRVQRAVAQHEVDAAVRDADVVEHHVQLVLGDPLPDRSRHPGEVGLGLLDPGAGRRPDVQPDLPGVHGREEVLPDRGQQERAARGDHDANAPVVTHRWASDHFSSPPYARRNFSNCRLNAK
jgi:hypothetical protein